MRGRFSGAREILISAAIDQLSNEPHDTIPGLRRRYYYRGSFVLLEHLTPRGLSTNVERLRRRGEAEHATRLEAAWNEAQAAARVRSRLAR
jgi:hypothetical protein